MSYPTEAITEFWNWFLTHRPQFETPGSPDSPFHLEATAQLAKLDPVLGFQAKASGSVYELVITAGGQFRVFPLVDELVASAPPVPGWKFTALKQPHGFTFTTSLYGTRFEPQAMWFVELEEASQPGKLAIRVGIPNFTSTTPAHAREAVTIVLETAIGERSLAEDLVSFEVVQLPRAPEPGGYIELFELPEVIEERKRG